MQGGVITVTGAIISANGVTLFQPNGQSLVLPQSDYRTRDILDATMGELAKGGKESVTINLDDFTVVKRVAAALPDAEVIVAESGAVTVKTEAGVVENLQEIENKLAGASPDAIREFVRKSALQTRKHSADELRTFIKRGDLPVADDGSIICYKILDKTSEPGRWLDCHSKKIPQGLGSVVEMPLEEINENRRQECGTGLHVCTVGYVRGFFYRNRTVTLVKVQPYDVVAVPEYESTKMRALAYHIVAEIPQHLHKLLESGKGLETDPEGAALLAEVVAGRHTDVTEWVKVVEGQPFVVKTGKQATPVRYNVETFKPKTAYVDPKEVNKALAAMKASPADAITAAVQPGVVKAPPIEQKRTEVSKQSPAPAALNHPAVTTRKIEEPVEQPASKTIGGSQPVKAKKPKKPAKDAPYEKRLAYAKWMFEQNISLRQIAAELGMDRKSLTKHLRKD